MEKKKFNLKNLRKSISSTLGLDSIKLNKEGALDVSAEDRTRMEELFGEDFPGKLESAMTEESQDKKKAKQTKSDMTKLKTAMIFALLGVESMEATDDGVHLSVDNMNAIEAELQKQKNLQTERDDAVSERTSAMEALDELDPSVKEADTLENKVEAVRTKLAEKPGKQPTGAQEETDADAIVIEGADAVSDYVKENL